ncbi:hypothetical protein Dimus_007212 [Dionaea muscipula]
MVLKLRPPPTPPSPITITPPPPPIPQNQNPPKYSPPLFIFALPFSSIVFLSNQTHLHIHPLFPLTFRENPSRNILLLFHRFPSLNYSFTRRKRIQNPRIEATNPQSSLFSSSFIDLPATVSSSSRSYLT